MQTYQDPTEKPKMIRRKLPFLTVGQIIDKLRDDGLTTFSRPTFYRLESRGKFKNLKYSRTDGGWRTFPRKTAIKIMVIIWGNFFGEEAAKAYKTDLLENF